MTKNTSSVSLKKLFKIKFPLRYYKVFSENFVKNDLCHCTAARVFTVTVIFQSSPIFMGRERRESTSSTRELDILGNIRLG